MCGSFNYHQKSGARIPPLFVVVTFVAAWFATCSARLSYLGVQIAVSFYLINLQEFKIQTSLELARDRVLGVFLGIFVMWVVFDQIWSAPAAVEMKKRFVSNLRLLARFAREPQSTDVKTAVEHSITLRETIGTNLDKVRALADGLLFEFGPLRQQNLILRERIRQWQTQLRVLFITRIALWKYRMRSPASSYLKRFGWRSVSSTTSWRRRWIRLQIGLRDSSLRGESHGLKLPSNI
jgi:multidrug resistance protein MdtO